MKSFSIILFCISIGLLHAQPHPETLNHQRIDSLKQRLRSSNGTERAMLLEKLAEALGENNNFDSTHLLLDQAEGIYKKLGDRTALVRLYLSYAKQLGAQHPTSIRALQKLYRGKTIAMHYDLPHHDVFLLYKALGDYHYRVGDDDSALHYNLQGLHVAKDTLDMIIALKRTGWSYNTKGVTIKALDALLKALKLLEHFPDPVQEAAVYQNLGILYEDDGDENKSEECYKKAAGIYAKNRNPEAEFGLWNNIGILYDHQHRYKESLAALAKAEALTPTLSQIPEHKLDRSIRLDINTANTLTHMGRAAEGIPLFQRAKRTAEQLNHHYQITLSDRQLAEAFYKVGKYKQGETHALGCINNAKKFGFTYLIKDAYHDLFDIYAATHQFEKAFKYQSLYLSMEDSINDKERRSKLGLLEKEYELSRKESEKQILEKENEVRKAQAKVDNITRLGLGGGLALFTIATILAGIGYFKTHSKNKLLAAQKAQIEESNIVITQQAAQLEETAKTKARFFANVSHELRTPVTLINGMLELMQTDTTPVNTENKMQIALASSRRLQSLVDEVLDLSRLDFKQVTLNKQRKELVPLLNRIVFAFESLLVRKNISLRYDASSVQHVWLDIDEDKFEKILNNLLYNAIKFNREGGWIQVEIKIHETQQEILIAVSDSGIGIPEKDLPHIFDRFYQSPNTLHKNAQGIGIGLSLVREFMLLHGGRVFVSSKLHQGSVFNLIFPLSVYENQVDTVETLEESIVDVVTDFSIFEKSPVVLIAEDNEEMRYYVKEIFKNAVTVIETSNGREALKQLKKQIPDLIISDVMMPEMDGYEFLAQVKSHEIWKHIPVIMLTARASEGDMLQGLSLGIDDYVIKPFNVRELKVRIYNMLKNHRERQAWLAKPIEKDEIILEKPEDRVFLEKVEVFVLERAANSQLGISDLAYHVAMSERQLYRYCANVTGMTPAQLIKEIRLKMAYRILTEGSVTKVSALASSVGFDNISYFSRQFFERFGKKPVDLLR